MSVEIITELTDELAEATKALLPQLSSSAVPLSAEQLREFLSQPDVYLFVFRGIPTDSEAPGTEQILGMLTLVTFQIPTGRRAWIEDVVVDAKARGQGAGQALVNAAVAKAQELGCRSVDLTSRPTRQAANRLYQRCGFERRETNVYRFSK